MDHHYDKYIRYIIKSADYIINNKFRPIKFITTNTTKTNTNKTNTTKNIKLTTDFVIENIPSEQEEYEFQKKLKKKSKKSKKIKNSEKMILLSSKKKFVIL